MKEPCRADPQPPCGVGGWLPVCPLPESWGMGGPYPGYSRGRHALGTVELMLRP